MRRFNIHERLAALARRQRPSPLESDLAGSQSEAMPNRPDFGTNTFTHVAPGSDFSPADATSPAAATISDITVDSNPRDSINNTRVSSVPGQRRSSVMTRWLRTTWAFFGRVMRLLRRVNLSVWIIIAVGIGIILGAFAPDFSVKIKPLSDIFLKMITTLIAPLIFSTLVVGITGHGDDLLGVGRLAIKSIVYFEIITTIALALGLIMSNLIKPGKGMSLEGAEAPDLSGSQKITWESELNKIVPKSFFEAASNNEVLQIVFCAIIFAIAIIRTKLAKHRHTMNDFLSSLSNIMFACTKIVMYYSPIGIGAAIASTVGKNGLKVLVGLGKLVGALYGTLVIFLLVVMLPTMLICKVPVVRFLRTIGQPFLIAFTTASSESALPLAMENLQKMGIPKNIVGFVIPIGYSFNLDGTSLYLSMAAIFCAQASNTHLSLSRQIVLMLTLMLTSKGVAAVPRASLVVLSAAISNFDIQPDTLGLIMGVDAFLDMARTSVNVFGNCLASVVMARWEGQYPPYGRWVGKWAAMDPDRMLPEVNSRPDDYHSHHTDRESNAGGETKYRGNGDESDNDDVKQDMRVVTYRTTSSDMGDKAEITVICSDERPSSRDNLDPEKR
ncbi:hypothetical protein EV182_001485 [Spiromyces aspiralis]|uniref:Uncharacterized protein n=1 Tax=Spiromyces aspiralis TaxID=68401 RepID=A0ACC1HFJ2_9FUNG|nr:hypothetical protein EV182_001485 [Spiromyces aspiralis]